MTVAELSPYELFSIVIVGVTTGVLFPVGVSRAINIPEITDRKRHMLTIALIAMIGFPALVGIFALDGPASKTIVDLTLFQLYCIVLTAAMTSIFLPMKLLRAWKNSEEFSLKIGALAGMFVIIIGGATISTIWTMFPQ